MQNKTRMLIVLFLGVLLGKATVLYAAEDTTSATAEAGTSDDQTAEEMLAAEAALEAQQAQAAGATEEPENASTSPLDGTAPATAAGGPPGADDEDFVPTIQISEDLSVSFPVDI